MVADGWQVDVGSSAGASDLHASGVLGAGVRSHAVSGLPEDGRRLYVRLSYEEGGAWSFRDFEYEAAGVAPLPDPFITSPVPGTQLAGDTVTFEWTPNQMNPDLWAVHVGSSPGAQDLHNSDVLGAGVRSHTVSGLPVDGRRLYVRLWYRVGGWLTRDYEYDAAGP